MDSRGKRNDSVSNIDNHTGFDILGCKRMKSVLNKVKEKPITSVWKQFGSIIHLGLVGEVSWHLENKVRERVWIDIGRQVQDELRET